MNTAKLFLFFRHAGSRAKMVINRLSAARSFAFYHERMPAQRWADSELLSGRNSQCAGETIFLHGASYK